MNKPTVLLRPHSWYLVEVDYTEDLWYKIVEKVPANKFIQYKEEIERYENDKRTVQESLDEIDSFYKERDEYGYGGRSSFSGRTEHRGKNIEIQQMGKNQNEERKTGGKAGRNSSRSSENRGKQLKNNFSLDFDSNGRKLTEQQAEYFKDSKVRDKKGSIRPVYHYTDGEFTQFAEMGESNGSRRTLGDGYYEYKNATMTRRAELLEEKRDGVADATREDILSWLAKNRRSTEKKKK